MYFIDDVILAVTLDNNRKCIFKCQLDEQSCLLKFVESQEQPETVYPHQGWK